MGLLSWSYWPSLYLTFLGSHFPSRSFAHDRCASPTAKYIIPKFQLSTYSGLFLLWFKHQVTYAHLVSEPLENSHLQFRRTHPYVVEMHPNETQGHGSDADTP